MSLEAFQQFGHASSLKMVVNNIKNAIVYTRVSSKEQADNNLSLHFQKKVIEEYAAKQGLSILNYFGGTYESAKTDGRKEFLRMLEFIKKHKGKVSHILVYTLDRFSRTGGGAIKLAQDLREKYGVSVFAVTQPTDTSNPSGVLHQNIQLLFSEFDNQLRKQRAVAGMKEKFQKGEWVTRVPQGYDIVKVNGVRKIVVNEEGKKLRKAFLWRADGMKNEEIIQRLNRMGVKMYKQQLTKLFKKPFYCGIINHGMLDGQVLEGNHEKLISKEIFLQVNGLHKAAANYGVPHKKERDEVPLKVFIKCEDCKEPFTGYIVKAKGLWYYKCRTKGCKCNKSAKTLHKQFEELLSSFSIDPKMLKPLVYQIEHFFEELNKEGIEQEKELKQKLIEVTKKLDTIEEKHYVLEEMNKESFEKFHVKYRKERDEIRDVMGKLTPQISNLKKSIEEALLFSTKLSAVWASSPVSEKEKLQKLVFPEGILYSKKIEGFRTEKVNSIFSLIAEAARILEEKKNGGKQALASLSPSAEREGFEPPDL
ncbi:recombinase family protein [Flavisolibacter ginsenosidimutans]|uniref:Recombinase family protein n=1 Tax=Flavisolibacter ginsenosidimutans TaxID=661481 RepID=A0A5B8UFY4_9BACT|nr:recombinase family protein [Flavisolibacter ginsenosidimutans]QEC55342.1 recombinase family protein [Flavisolibacter ginsenosidimutans]